MSRNLYLTLVCLSSLSFYLAFSHGLRFLFSDWDYHTKLVKMVSAQGIRAGMPRDIPPVVGNSVSHTTLLLVALLAAWLLVAVLTHSLVRGDRSELGPHLILFSLAAAILPTHVLAMIFWPDGRGTLTLETTAVCTLGIAIVLAGVKLTLIRRGAPPDPEPPLPVRGRLGWGWLFLPPLALLLGVTFLRGYVTSFSSYDSLAYHLPMAASWLHDGRITRGFSFTSYYPGNAALLIRWSLLDGSERFAFLTSYVSALSCVYMIYKVGRQIGQDREAALVAACCSATFPLVPFLAITAQADLPGVLFLLLSLFFLIRWLQSDLTAGKHLFCAGLAAGLAAGTKLSMLQPVFAIALAASAAALRSRLAWRSPSQYVWDETINWSWLLTRGAAFSSAALLGGGYWYVRDLIEMGNPLYPVALLGLPGLELRAMVPNHPAFAANPLVLLLYPWIEFPYDSIFDDGIGAVAAGISIPALLLWPLVRKDDDSRHQVGARVVVFVTAFSLLMFACSSRTVMRMGILPIVAGFILVGEIWRGVPSRWIRGMTFVAFLIMTAAITQKLAGGCLYEYLHTDKPRTERLHVPEAVDTVRPTRILNAASAVHTYGLMGWDFRHEVINLFREVKPADVIETKATHVLLTKGQVDPFRARLPLEQVGMETVEGEMVSLWKVGLPNSTGAARTGRPN